MIEQGGFPAPKNPDNTVTGRFFWMAKESFIGFLSLMYVFYHTGHTADLYVLAPLLEKSSDYECS